MGKGVWEKAFSSKDTGGEPIASSPESLSTDGVRDDSSASADWSPTRKKSVEFQGTWEAAFSGGPRTGVRAQASENGSPAQAGEQPPAASHAESGSSSDAGPNPVQSFHSAHVYREKTKTGPPLLTKMGDFLDKIWLNIHLETADRHSKTFLFCGATRGVGATFISFYFSLSLALERSMKVLYVDANMDDPNQPSIISDMRQHPGLASYLAGYRSLESLILQTQYKNLSVLPSGAHEMLDQANSGFQKPKAVSEFVDYCKTHFDATIFDGQPAMEYPSTTTFAKAVDQTILVCKYGFSRREVLKLAIDRLKESGVSVAGVILNERQYPIPAYVYRILK